jgi:nicotinate phosphoribosyltransferase
VPAAIQVAKEFEGKLEFTGIRLDGGDMAYLSKKTREMLDEAGFHSTQIVASSDLDEQTILSLQAQGAKIDVWGIGTKLITAFDQPALGAVYKIVAIEDEKGKMVDTIKISSNPEKVTTPGMKKVYRIVNTINQKSEGDYIALEGEDPQKEERLKMFHPTHTFIKKFVTDFEARDLHTDIFKNGKLVYDNPDIYEIQQFASENLNLLWEEYQRTLNPEEYPVDLSPKCWENKMTIIQEIKAEVKGRSK